MDGSDGIFTYSHFKRIFVCNIRQLEVFNFKTSLLNDWVNVLLNIPEKIKHHNFISKLYAYSAHLPHKLQVTHSQKDY